MSRPRFGRAGIAGVLLALGGAATLALLPSDPLIGAKLHDLLHPLRRTLADLDDPDARAKDDVSLGCVLPTDGTGAAIRKACGPSSSGCLIVGLGDCASCMRLDVSKWEADANQRHLKIVGFTTADITDASAFQKQLRVSMPIVIDRGGSLHTYLNSYWAGRVYYFGSTWKLSWQMKGFGSDAGIGAAPGLASVIAGVSK